MEAGELNGKSVDNNMDHYVIMTLKTKHLKEKHFR